MTQPLPFDPIEEAARQWHARWGGEPLAAMRAVTSVMRVQQLWLGRLNEALRVYGLTFARYEALMLLHFSRDGSLPLGKIGARLQVHPTSVTNLIDGLEQQGLVRREPHPSDRRTTLASVTAQGRSVARRATEALHEIRFGTAPLDDVELDRLSELLRSARVAAGDFEEEGAAPPAPTAAGKTV
jgi:DNA-binding MarR family transcriptional regulator